MRRVLLGELCLRFPSFWMEESALNGEVRVGDRATGVPSMRGHMLIAGSPTKLSLLSCATPAEPGERAF